MQKETYIKISMSEKIEDVDINFSCKGNFEDLVYMTCEIANRLKEHMVKGGSSEIVAKQVLLMSIEQSLNNFENLEGVENE